MCRATRIVTCEQRTEQTEVSQFKVEGSEVDGREKEQRRGARALYTICIPIVPAQTITC